MAMTNSPGTAAPANDARTGALGSVLLCLGLFTAIPLPTAAVPNATRARSAAALRVLPVIGAGLGAAAGGVAVALLRGGSLLAAAAAIAVLTVLARGLHLDGLADLADGLGSHRAGPEALAIMRQSDIGPFGVGAVVLTVLLEVGAIAGLAHRDTGPQLVVAVAAAAAASRLAALTVATPRFPAAHPDGFGALVAGSSGPAVRLGGAVLIAAATAAGGAAVGLGARAIAVSAVAVVAGQLTGYLTAWHAVRRLGGMTGDVFGACVEVALATSLVVLAVWA